VLVPEVVRMTCSPDHPVDLPAAFTVRSRNSPIYSLEPPHTFFERRESNRLKYRTFYSGLLPVYQERHISPEYVHVGTLIARKISFLAKIRRSDFASPYQKADIEDPVSYSHRDLFLFFSSQFF